MNGVRGIEEKRHKQQNKRSRGRNQKQQQLAPKRRLFSDRIYRCLEKRKKRAKAISSFVLAQSHVSHTGSIQPWMLIISFPSCLLVYFSAQPGALSWFCLFTKAQKKSKSLFSGSPWRIVKTADSGKKNHLTLITSLPAPCHTAGPQMQYSALCCKRSSSPPQKPSLL